jgi:hypothetical protein
MDIKQTAQHLQRLAQPFDVIISNNGQERTLYKNLAPTDVESLLNEVIDTHAPDKLIIQERKRNGSTNVKQEKYPIQLSGLNGSQEQVAMQPQQPVSVQGLPNDYKDYLISDLKEKNGKLESKLSKVEEENENLKRENFELEKENKYKDKEFELERKSQEFEKSNGLSGIMETVGNNPVLANVAATALTRIMGIEQPQLPEQSQQTMQGAETGEDANTLQAKVAANIKAWLQGVDEETAKQFYNMVTIIAADVNQISTVIELLQNGEE